MVIVVTSDLITLQQNTIPASPAHHYLDQCPGALPHLSRTPKGAQDLRAFCFVLVCLLGAG